MANRSETVKLSDTEKQQLDTIRDEMFPVAGTSVPYGAVISKLIQNHDEADATAGVDGLTSLQNRVENHEREIEELRTEVDAIDAFGGESG